MDEEEVRRIWEISEIKKFTEKTVTDYEELCRELDKIRSLGYAEDDEENELGVRCIGAPVFNYRGEVEGAISISGPTLRITKDRVEEIAKSVMKYAQLISRELGYRASK